MFIGYVNCRQWRLVKKIILINAVNKHSVHSKRIKKLKIFARSVTDYHQSNDDDDDDDDDDVYCRPITTPRTISRRNLRKVSGDGHKMAAR